MAAILCALSMHSPLADEAGQRAEVQACFTENAATPDQCLPVALAPCADQDSAGLLRRCFHRLHKTWEQETDLAENERLAASPPALQRWIRLRGPVWRKTVSRKCEADVIALLGDRNANPRTVETACSVYQHAAWQYRMTIGQDLLAREYAALRADVESVEACVLETAHVGEEASCTGLIASGCAEENTDAQQCLAHEALVWHSIAQTALVNDLPEAERGELQNLPSRFRGKHVTGCGADDGSDHYARCQMRSIARLSGDLFLAVEGD